MRLEWLDLGDEFDQLVMGNGERALGEKSCIAGMELGVGVPR